MAWGPLGNDMKPVSRDKGKDYLKWVSTIEDKGYSFDKRLLNSANYGAFTSRTRFFGVFTTLGVPIVFPEQTHIKTTNGFFNDLQPWRPVKDVLDLSDEGQSIFTRKKPLVENTLKRIYAGLTKFVPNDHFLISYYGNGGAHNIESPCPTVTTHDRFSKIHVSRFIDNQYGNGNASSINQPLNTLTPVVKQNIVTVKHHFIMNPQYKSKGASIYNPCFTLIARMDKAPPSLVTSVEGLVNIVINEDDNPTMIKIKQFMAEHKLIDIKTRMIRIPELKKITGFPVDYILKGPKMEQKKFIGNAVVCIIPKLMIERICKSL